MKISPALYNTAKAIAKTIATQDMSSANHTPSGEHLWEVILDTIALDADKPELDIEIARLISDTGDYEDTLTTLVKEYPLL